MNNLVTVNDLALFCKREPRTIQLWDEEFTAKYGSARVEHGKYNFLTFIQNRIMYLEEQLEIAKNSGDEKLHTLKVEWQKTANKTAILKHSLLERSLIPYDAARLAWLDETTNFRNNVLAVIPKLTTALNLTEEKDKAKVRELIYEVLTMLGEWNPDTLDEEEETSLISEVEQLTNEEKQN